MEVLASVILYVQIGSKQNTLNMYATSSQLLLLDSRKERKVSVTAMDSTSVIVLGLCSMESFFRSDRVAICMCMAASRWLRSLCKC